MNLRQAINASDLNMAKLVDQNGMYTVVDGSQGDGSYLITEGVEGMPPRKTVTAKDLNEAVSLVGDESTDGWEPIGVAS